MWNNNKQQLLNWFNRWFCKKIHLHFERFNGIDEIIFWAVLLKTLTNFLGSPSQDVDQPSTTIKNNLHRALRARWYHYCLWYEFTFWSSGRTAMLFCPTVQTCWRYTPNSLFICGGCSSWTSCSIGQQRIRIIQNHTWKWNKNKNSSPQPKNCCQTDYGLTCK